MRKGMRMRMRIKMRMRMKDEDEETNLLNIPNWNGTVMSASAPYTLTNPGD